MVPQPIRHTKSILWSVRSHQDTAKILKTFMGAFAAWIETVRTGANSHGFGAFLQKRDAIARDFVNGDSAALEKIVAQQDPATFFSPSGDIEQGAAKVASIHKKSARMFSKPGKSELEILQHDASGDLAFWTGLQRRRGAAGAER